MSSYTVSLQHRIVELEAAYGTASQGFKEAHAEIERLTRLIEHWRGEAQMAEARAKESREMERERIERLVFEKNHWDTDDIIAAIRSVP